MEKNYIIIAILLVVLAGLSLLILIQWRFTLRLEKFLSRNHFEKITLQVWITDIQEMCKAKTVDKIAKPTDTELDADK